MEIIKLVTEHGKNRISRLMKENNVENRLKRKFKATTYSDHNFSIALNLLQQKFTINEPNKAYVGDITLKNIVRWQEC